MIIIFNLLLLSGGLEEPNFEDLKSSSVQANIVDLDGGAFQTKFDAHSCRAIPIFTESIELNYTL